MADLTVDISCTKQCPLIWQTSLHLLCNIHCIITHKYIVHKVIYARMQWAVLVYKGSCREGEAVSCSVSRSRGGAERHWRAHNSAQCNSARTVQGSQPHCRLASAPTRGSTVQPFVPHRLPLSTFTLLVLLHLHWLVGVSVAICASLFPRFAGLKLLR